MSSDDAWDNEDSDDDNWEEDIKKKKEEQPEEELTVDDIEEMKRKEAEAQAAAAPKPKKKPKDTKEEKPVNPEDLPYYVELEDPVAEKQRRQKLVEEADARLAGDLFSGLDTPQEEEQAAKEKAAKEKAEKEAAEKKKAEKAKVTVVVNDAFENLELKTQEDVVGLLGTCLEKINASKSKGAAQKFFLDCLKALEPMLTGEEVRELEKSVNQVVKAKKVEKQQADAAKKKSNDTPSKNTKFNIHDEVAVVYGGDDWDDWDEDEDWEGAAAYAPPKR